MHSDRNRRQAALSWVFVCLLVALSVTLGVLQYRWIGQVSVAESQQMRTGLQGSLNRLSIDFNSEVTAACVALMPPAGEPDEANRDAAYTAQYLHWRDSGHHSGMFRRIGVAAAGEAGISLKLIDLDSGAFHVVPWPPELQRLHERLAARASGERGPPGPFEEARGMLIQVPRFLRPSREGEGGPPRERPPMEWMIFDLDPVYVRTYLLPELLQHHLGSGRSDYQVEVVNRENPADVIFRAATDHPIGSRADASVPLFEVQFEQFFRRAGMARMREGRRGEGRMMPPMQGRPPDRGRWILSVQHRSGSVEAMVAAVRRRNLAVTTSVLVLLLAAVAALVRFTQRAQNLARMQMDFVAGVSHELRTPLAVIRTAAHNLGRGVVADPKQVQRYGSLIRDESERLTNIVEQVLRFASARAGRTIGEREPVALDTLVDDVLASLSSVIAPSRCKVEKTIEPDLPPVSADPVALRHVLQNLLTNAAKYGADGGWIGISAISVENGAAVEFRVADRGAGIPAGEIDQIFDPFYRGKWALDNQIHGTGLGLNLAKRIVDAHNGTITVTSEPGKGAVFVVRWPAAPADQIDEFADSVSRG